nr:hypothetical protein GCM10020093_022080 [Planobispora longispora]
MTRLDPARPFDAADLALIADIGRRAALAVDNAHLSARQRDTAETMQRHLLDPLPRVGRLRLAARYRPAPQGSPIGGDWYDALVLPDGVTAAIIGDVAGRDMTVAAHMAQLRHMLRSLCWDRQEPPSLIIDRLDDAVINITDIATATVIMARFEGPDAGPWQLHWVSAATRRRCWSPTTATAATWTAGRICCSASAWPGTSHATTPSNRCRRAARCCCTPTGSSKRPTATWTAAWTGCAVTLPRWPAGRSTISATSCWNAWPAPAPTTSPCWRRASPTPARGGNAAPGRTGAPVRAAEGRA